MPAASGKTDILETERRVFTNAAELVYRIGGGRFALEWWTVRTLSSMDFVPVVMPAPTSCPRTIP